LFSLVILLVNAQPGHIYDTASFELYARTKHLVTKKLPLQQED